MGDRNPGSKIMQIKGAGLNEVIQASFIRETVCTFSNAHLQKN